MTGTKPFHRPCLPRGTVRGWLVGALLVTAACANIEPPPGGPQDQSAPVLVETVPDSLGVFPGYDGRVEFVFNEVVSEGQSPNLGLGTGSLERLILLSPSDQIPKISWRHNRVTVKPREGWQPDRVYRVQLLPGITDIERNRSSTGAVVTFSTGAPLPTDTIRGSLIDWVAGRPVSGGLVLATLLPDSLTYRGLADSTGAFAFGPLPQGEYLVYGIIDQNNNVTWDPKEAFDSLRIAPGTSDVGALWAYPHDTTGPRIASLSVVDSLTVSVTFNQPLDPSQQVDSAAVRVVMLPDSIPVAASTLLPQAEHDSLYPRIFPTDSTAADSGAVVDSLAPVDSVPPADSTGIDSLAPALPGIDTGPIPGAVDSAMQAILDQRPRLYDRLLLRLAAPLAPEGQYFVIVSGIRNVNGVASEESGAGFIVPAAPPPPPEPGPEDSLAAPDTTGVTPDSLARPDSVQVSDP